MSRSGAVPASKPTGWVHLASDCTIRWQRGDRKAYVLRGNQVGKRTTGEVIGTIPVSPNGWVDAAEIKLAGERWVRSKHPCCPMCGGSSP